MAVWVAYSKIFYKGKPAGHAFRGSGFGRTEAEARRKATRSNNEWNRWQKDKNYSVRIVSIKKIRGEKIIIRKGRHSLIRRVKKKARKVDYLGSLSMRRGLF